MEHDQRILDIISAANDGKPADIEAPFNEVLGERIAAVVAARKDELANTFFGEPEAELETPVDEDANEDA